MVSRAICTVYFLARLTGRFIPGKAMTTAVFRGANLVASRNTSWLDGMGRFRRGVGGLERQS